MTFTIVSVSTASEVITIQHILKLRGPQPSGSIYFTAREEKVVVEEIHTENPDGKPPMGVVWEWFIPPSDEFLSAMKRESVGGTKVTTPKDMLHKCRDEIVRQSRRES